MSILDILIPIDPIIFRRYSSSTHWRIQILDENGLYSQIFTQLAGNKGEITEDNVIEQTLSAMQFILQADQDTLNLILEEFNKFDLDGATSTPMVEDKDNKGAETDGMKQGYEMTCYPMSDDDMKKYMQDNKMQAGRNGTMTGGHSTAGKPKNMTGHGDKDMMDKRMCGSCKTDAVSFGSKGYL